MDIDVEKVITENVEPVVPVEENRIPVVNSVIDEPPTAKIPVEEVKKLVEAEKEVIEEPVAEEPVVETVEPTVSEEKVEEVKEDKAEEKTQKPTNYKGFCIVLAIFLLASIILNCFLLFNASGDSSVVKASGSSLVNLKTVYKNYKFSLPYSWVVNGDNEEYLLIHNDSETWAASISLAEGLNCDLVKDNTDEIMNVVHMINEVYEKFGFKKIGTHPAFFKIGGKEISFDYMCLKVR